MQLTTGRGFAGTGPVFGFRDEPRVKVLGHGHTVADRISRRGPRLVSAGLGVLDEVEHGQQELAALRQDLGEAIWIECREAVWEGNDVVALSHRWWLLCKGLTTTR